MWSLHSHLGSYYLCSSLGNECIYKFDDFICILNMKYMKFLTPLIQFSILNQITYNNTIIFIYSRPIQILINKMWSLQSHLGS